MYPESLSSNTPPKHSWKSIIVWVLLGGIILLIIIFLAERLGYSSPHATVTTIEPAQEQLQNPDPRYYVGYRNQAMNDTMKSFIDSWLAQQSLPLAKAAVSSATFATDRQQFVAYILLGPSGTGDAESAERLCLVLFNGSSEAGFTTDDQFCVPDNFPDKNQYSTTHATSGANFVDVNNDEVFDFVTYGTGSGASSSYGGILAIDPTTRKFYQPKNDLGQEMNSWITYGSAGGGSVRRDFNNDSYSSVDFIDSSRVTKGEDNTVTSCDYRAYNWDVTKKLFITLKPESQLGKKRLCDDTSVVNKIKEIIGESTGKLSQLNNYEYNPDMEIYAVYDQSNQNVHTWYAVGINRATPTKTINYVLGIDNGASEPAGHTNEMDYDTQPFENYTIIYPKMQTKQKPASDVRTLPHTNYELIATDTCQQVPPGITDHWIASSIRLPYGTFEATGPKQFLNLATYNGIVSGVPYAIGSRDPIFQGCAGPIAEPSNLFSTSCVIGLDPDVIGVYLAQQQSYHDCY